MWQHNFVTNQSCAFFDVDNTLISIKSMLSFLDYLDHNSSLISHLSINLIQEKIKNLSVLGTKREDINEFYYSVFEGVSAESLAEKGRCWYDFVSKQPSFFHYHTINRLREHQSKGDNIVIVSGSGLAMLEPLATALGINAILCAPQELKQGKYTGGLFGSPCIGEGKAHYIRELLDNNDYILSISSSYGDDVSDFPMLSITGKGYLVSPNENVLKANQHRGFEVIDECEK